MASVSENKTKHLLTTLLKTPGVKLNCSTEQDKEGEGAQGLEAQLLREVVAQERGELEEAKERLLLSLAADTRQLQDLQDRILKLLKVTPPSVKLNLAKENSKTLKDFDWFFLFLRFCQRLRSWVVSDSWHTGSTVLNSLPS